MGSARYDTGTALAGPASGIFNIHIVLERVESMPRRALGAAARSWAVAAFALATVAAAAPAGDLRLLWQRGGHLNACTSIICSADGATVVSADWDATIKFWRVSDGRLLRTWRSRAAPVALAWGPDGRHLAWGDGYEAFTGDLATGQITPVAEEHFSNVEDVAFSPDGVWVATVGSFDHLAFLRSASDWSVVHQLPVPPRLGQLTPIGVAFTTDSSKVYIGTYTGPVIEYRVADGAFLRTFAASSVPVYHLAVSPDGALLLAGDDAGVIRRWSLPAGAALAPINVHQDKITALEFSPDGTHFLSASLDGTVRIWRASDGALLQTLAGHPASVAGAAFSPDGASVFSGTASPDSALRQWAWSSGQLLRVFTVHNDVVHGLAFSPDGAVLASGAGSDVRLWDAGTGEPAGSIIAAHERDLRRLAFAPQGGLLASCGRNTGARLWEYPGLVSAGTLPTQSSYLGSIAFSLDGSLLASAGQEGADHGVRLIRMADRQIIGELPTDDAPLPLAFSPDGATVAFAHYSVLKLMRVSDGAVLHTLTGHTSQITDLAYAPDGASVASCSRDATARLWRTSDGTPLHVLTAELPLHALAFAPDGRTLVTSGWENTIAVWRVADGALLGRYASPLQATLETLAFSPDGRRLALGRYDGTVIVASRPPATGGDLDGDGDVDTADHAAFALCLGGPQVADAGATACSPQNFIDADFDGDGDVDLADGAVLQQVFTAAQP